MGLGTGAAVFGGRVVCRVYFVGGLRLEAGLLCFGAIGLGQGKKTLTSTIDLQDINRPLKPMW